MGDRRPTLSVVLATVDAGPELSAALDAVTEPTLALGGEVLLVTCVGVVLPPAVAASGVEILEVRTADVFELRAAGLAAARGETIALIEDHVIVSSGWAQATLRAHERHPEAWVVAGAIGNGSPRRLSDWANFLMTFGSFMPPITAERHGRMPAIANVSLKRAALASLPLAPGDLEFALLPRLAGENRIAFDDEPFVWHVQSPGPVGVLRLHFHNGRATAGMPVLHRRWPVRRGRGSLRRLRGLAGDALATVRERPLPARARASLPLLLLLCSCHVAGEWVGATFGPGRSAERLA